MIKFDTKQLEEDLAKKKYLNIGAVATYVNNINRLFNTIDGHITDYQIFYRGHADNTFQEIPSEYRLDSNGNLWEKGKMSYVMRLCGNVQQILVNLVPLSIN